MKEPLLFLCHRIPFPPNKGDKIRSFNILKKLSEQYDIYLGCFIDDPVDHQYKGELDHYCKGVLALEQNKTLAKIKGLTGFISQKPITLPYYYDGQMAAWVKQTIKTQKINKVFVYSSSMAQYCDDKAHQHLNRVIDFVDVDSDKWRQYAQKKTGIAKWFFNREYQLLGQYEDEVCAEFDHSLFVSPDEANLFRARQQQVNQTKVHGLLNGVDVDFFDPKLSTCDEVSNTAFISFTGAMDYWANVDAVVWFVENVWQAIKQAQPELDFYIVGGNPTSAVKALTKYDGVIVTGRVEDIRPYITQAKLVVAPLRIARGIQNKVLEAMSLNKPIVLTQMAMEGINAAESDVIKVVDDAQPFAQACLSLLNNPPVTCDNRAWIETNFTWQQTLKPLSSYFTGKGEP